MLKGALLGVGNVAVGGHLPGWRSRAGVEIVAGADARPERRALLHKSFPEARWYDTAEDLLARETLDFVDICTPPWAHAALVRSALERSIHVLCEKPLILSPEELRGLPALAADKDRTLCTVHNWLHSPALAQMTERVRAGALGDVRRVAWETLRDQPAAAAGDHDNWRVDPARAGGGILMDHGWHALYCLSAWLPGEPRRVAARLETRKHTQWKVEDTAT
ncbi:MAG: Gfo/Idh/MocA family oxidoreductase, partial [Acidobacteriota bacterium]